MDRRVQTAIRIIHRDINRNLTVGELAEQIHLSRWHFIHLFKTETSFTPKQYSLKLKMKRAAKLLNDSFLSVKEVAADLGFSDQSHFSREFKRFWGVSPTGIKQRKRLAN